ncbi:hypothetical protein BT96DRAFT_1025810 [Gymnopus androsaceus JB14]|uniref:Uncharacterized protein n=1 Tax=Gymnopus androsaceus JB14 TaxID=1447944 RepID=A0A6A4GQC8_9AGAR|nr:hypothetical protein BT96DRAFT_1025810 [Gymnopus androsaceus JB14]
MPLQIIGNDSQHPLHTHFIIRHKKQFMADQVALCALAQDRPRLECDVYGVWDPLWHLFPSMLKDINPGRPTATIGVMSQYRIEKVYANGVRRYKVPDTVVLSRDDTRRKRLLFWAEIKPLKHYDWFSQEAYAFAMAEIIGAVGQVNTQAQFICEEFRIRGGTVLFTIQAFIICGPYWVFVEYTDNSLSPDFFDIPHGPTTRSQADDAEEEEAEEEEEEDIRTRPVYPYGSVPRCLFKMKGLGDDQCDDDVSTEDISGDDLDDLDGPSDGDEDCEDEDEDVDSEMGFGSNGDEDSEESHHMFGEFTLNLPLGRYHINPVLLKALRRIMNNHHADPAPNAEHLVVRLQLWRLHPVGPPRNCCNLPSPNQECLITLV